MIVLRSMLYFPGNNVRMAVKAATLPADAVIFDLEDAVTLDDKETARIIARDFIGLIKRHGINTFVRVNSLTTGLTIEDLKSTVVEGLDGVMLPKAETESDLSELDKILSKIEEALGLTAESIKLIPLIETAKGVTNSFEIASASSRVVAVAFGAGDYYRDLGRDVSSLSKEENELLYARSQIVNTSRAAGLQAIDTPFLGLLTDREGFLRETRLALQLGFKGKQCIHPSQIEPLNNIFSPSQEEVDRAKRTVEVFEEAQARGLGAISFEGKMVDYMTYQHAKDVIVTAQIISDKENATDKMHPVSLSEVFSCDR